jgi:hypothetical protein
MVEITSKTRSHLFVMGLFALPFLPFALAGWLFSVFIRLYCIYLLVACATAMVVAYQNTSENGPNSIMPALMAGHDFFLSNLLLIGVCASLFYLLSIRRAQFTARTDLQRIKVRVALITHWIDFSSMKNSQFEEFQERSLAEKYLHAALEKLFGEEDIDVSWKPYRGNDRSTFRKDMDDVLHSPHSTTDRARW